MLTSAILAMAGGYDKAAAMARRGERRRLKRRGLKPEC